MENCRVNARIVEAGYRKGVPAVRDVTLEVGAGELVLVVGRSGSGKTTTMLALTGVIVNLLEGYVRGRSRLCGINPLSPDGFLRVPEKVGVVLQDPDKQLSLITPLDEVMFVLENLGVPEDEALARARSMLERFGLAEKALTDSSRLSGGEKRRLTLAAALVHEPAVLIFDEPTASVDPWGIRELRDVIVREKQRGRSIIVIEHKARFFLDLADRIIGMRNGEMAGAWERREVDTHVLASIGADLREPVVRDWSFERGRVILEVADLSIGYEDNVLVRNVSFDLREGDVLALVGPNGSGKTTLLKTITGLHKPLSGEIRFAGGVRPFYVPQLPDYMFMMRTVRSELEFSAERGLGRDAINTVLGEASWLREKLGESPYRLSHGQRRWLTLMIAYLHGARVLLLDEPSTGLDIGLFSMLCRNIEWWARRGAVIVSTHDPRLVGECSSRAAMIVDGRLVEADRSRVVRWMEEAWRGSP